MAFHIDKFKYQSYISGSTYYIPGEYPNAKDPSLVWIAEENCFLLDCPVAGETTANSEKTRAEFRECNVDGDEVNFSPSAPHVLRVKQKLLQVNSINKVIIGQTHVKNNNYPMLKVFFDNGNIKVGFRKTYNQEVDEKFVIASGVEIGDVLNYSITNSGNGTTSVFLTVNGVAVPTWTGTFDSSWDGKFLYSKAGVYNSLDAALSTGPNDRTISNLYKLEIA